MSILKYLLVWNAIALLVIAGLVIAVYLGSCFVYLDWTPENMTFEGGEEARLCILLSMLIVSIFAVIHCFDAKREMSEKIKREAEIAMESENFKNPEYRKLVIENIGLKREIEELKTGNQKPQVIHRADKSPSATDIAIGVGTGIIGAEIVSNIFDL